MESHWKFLGGGGREVLETKLLEAKYEAILEFPRGGGCKTKTFHGGVWTFSGTAQHMYKISVTLCC